MTSSRAIVASAAVVAASIVTAAGCIGASAQPSPKSPQLANPASVRCVEKGGSLRIERRPDGAQFGVCLFVDNYQCEEWALLRGECPQGGLRVTGYATSAGRYCAITGGRYAVVTAGDVVAEKGVCSLPGGKSCDADAYYSGSCSR